MESLSEKEKRKQDREGREAKTATATLVRVEDIWEMGVRPRPRMTSRRAIDSRLGSWGRKPGEQQQAGAAQTDF